jgi:hypothetical protein
LQFGRRGNLQVGDAKAVRVQEVVDIPEGQEVVDTPEGRDAQPVYRVGDSAVGNNVWLLYLDSQMATVEDAREKAARHLPSTLSGVLVVDRDGSLENAVTL